FYNQESSYTLFQTDLNPNSSIDQEETFQRFDFHPQLSIPFRPATWITFTPIIGFRETYYSKGLDSQNQALDGFSRELVDINAVVEGPKFRKVYFTGSAKYPKINHVIEPRMTYEYISDINGDDSLNNIKVFDSIDTIRDVHRMTYTLNQRILRKKILKDNQSVIDQIMRLELKQSYDIREATRILSPGTESHPFSDLRLDLDSRFFEPLMVNFDTKFDVYDRVFNTLNLEVGIKPTEMLTLFFERRFTRNSSTFLQGTIDLKLDKGWRAQYSSRFDEQQAKFQENDFSIAYNDPCQCWGFGFDFIKRNNINGGLNQDDTRFMFNLNLKGIGEIGTNKQDKLLHRGF
ncbi:MAG: LPS assembly protein LptD, partial [Nitrospinota bacterium]|nr:LPS assembly protein LptD [Nitrospinota bacterium]